MPLGSVLAGIFVQSLGIVPMLVGMGATVLLVTVSMLVNPRCGRSLLGEGSGRQLRTNKASIQLDLTDEVPEEGLRDVVRRATRS